MAPGESGDESIHTPTTGGVADQPSGDEVKDEFIEVDSAALTELFVKVHKRLCFGPSFDACQNAECVTARQIMGLE